MALKAERGLSLVSLDTPNLRKLTKPHPYYIDGYCRPSNVTCWISLLLDGFANLASCSMALQKLCLSPNGAHHMPWLSYLRTLPWLAMTVVAGCVIVDWNLVLQLASDHIYLSEASSLIPHMPVLENPCHGPAC